MTEWRETTLGEVVDIFDNRRVPLSSAQRANRQGPYPYYGAQGVIDHIDDFIFDGRFILIPEDGENLRSRKLPIAYFADGKFWVNNHAHIVKAKPGVANDRFVQSALEVLHIDAFITGAGQPKLSQANLRNIPVLLPSLERQELIAEILDALDDLIDNNRRRIELSEQMAQAIYKEWFVRFRYPGHENASFVDSPLGPIPEGWEVKRLSAIAHLTMGQSPSSEHYNSEGVGRPFHQGVKDFGRHFPTNRKYCSIEGRLAKDGDALISVRAPVGRLSIACDDLVIGRGLAAARSLTGQQALLFRSLRDVVFAEEDSMGGGTIFKAIGKEDVERIQLICPPARLATAAETVFADNLALLRSLTFANRNLTALRDVLLPKLVTGQIDVSELDLDSVLETVA